MAFFQLAAMVRPLLVARRTVPSVLATGDGMVVATTF